MDTRSAVTSWLWHVFNDPIRENPWSLAVLALLLICAIIPLLAMWTKASNIVLMKWRRAEMNRDDVDPNDKDTAAAAVERARTVAEPEPATTYDAVRQAEGLSEDAYFTDSPEPEPSPVSDSGVHALPDTPRLVMQVECAECGGHGYVEMTVSDLLRESFALIPDDGGDMVVKEFYTQLLAVAPSLAPLFPDDLLTAQAGDRSSRGFRQRDKLYEALAALASLYDPDDADKMGRLATAGAAFGRAHANFYRPDENVTRGASLEEYGAVKAVLFATFGAIAGEAWKPAYTLAWSKAYDHLTGIMLVGQHSTTFTASRFPRS